MRDAESYGGCWLIVSLRIQSLESSFPAHLSFLSSKIQACPVPVSWVKSLQEKNGFGCLWWFIFGCWAQWRDLLCRDGWTTHFLKKRLSLLIPSTLKCRNLRCQGTFENSHKTAQNENYCENFELLIRYGIRFHLLCYKNSFIFVFCSILKKKDDKH